MLVIEENTIVRRVDHSCTGNIAEVEVAKVMHNCKKRAREETDVPVNVIFQKEIQKCYNQGLELVASLPLYENAKTSLNRQRRNALGVIQDPTEATEIVIPEDIKHFDDGSPFLVFDDIEDGKRILVFSHMAHKNVINEGKTLFVDGTGQIMGLKVGTTG